MPSIKLTKRAIDALEPGDERENYWDTEVGGFGLRITPNGDRIYVVKYRAGDKQRWYRIGRHGSPWTPDAARSEAVRILGDVSRGLDPGGARKAARTAMTFSELCDLYFAEGATKKKPSTLRSDRTRARLHLVPLLGGKRVEAIVRDDIDQMRAAVESGRSVARKPLQKRGPGSVAKGGPGAAAQCVALASSILQFAVFPKKLRPDNPALGVYKPKVREIERFLSSEEFGRLADSLVVETEQTNALHAVAAIRLLTFTGCRRGEIAGLKWAEVDFERRLLNLPDSKTGKKVVHLNEPAIEILRAVPRVAGNPFVIAGGAPGRPSGAIDKTWARVRKRAGLEDVRLHDLRHTFASVGAGASFGLPVIGKLLGHKHASTTARYAHLADDPTRRANDAIGATIAAAFRLR